MENLKRRFSSGDLSSEFDDDVVPGEQVPGQAPVPPSANEVRGHGPAQPQPPPLPSQPRPNSRTISAPTSPTRSTSILQRVQSLTGAAKEVGRDLISSAVGGAMVGGGTVGGVKLPLKKEGVYYLLIVDDSDTDWLDPIIQMF